MTTKLESWGHYKLQGASTRSVAEREFVVRTPLGMVLVLSVDPLRSGPYTYYETIVDGRIHYAKEEGRRNRTGAAIVAHRWIKSLSDAD